MRGKRLSLKQLPRQFLIIFSAAMRCPLVAAMKLIRCLLNSGGDRMRKIEESTGLAGGNWLDRNVRVAWVSEVSEILILLFLGSIVGGW